MSDVDSENDDEFQFETDYVALRGNKDYCALLKHIILLEVQKIKAVKDIETLDSMQKNAVANPIQFVEDFKSGQMEFPSRQLTPEMPKIDWSKYGMDDPMEFQLKRELTAAETCDQGTLVRGRVFTQSKPVTFNQLWTCEEQRRLEELLEVYPEEEVEIRRWEKVANALGNRTTTQVMSRVQKYFLKLAQAGLPIPGRSPKNNLLLGLKPPHKAKAQKKSTFFPEHHVPVTMDNEMYSGIAETRLDRDLQSTETKWQRLSVLKMAREQRNLDEFRPVIQAVSITCNNCMKSGFPGARWICEKDADIVWCTDCVVQCVPLLNLKPIRTVEF